MVDIISITGFHLPNPLLITGRGSRNRYLEANGIRTHLNIFQTSVFPGSLEWMLPLRGQMEKLEIQQTSTLYETYGNEIGSQTASGFRYSFLPDGQLTRIEKITEDRAQKELFAYKPSLREPLTSVLQTELHGEPFARKTIFRDTFMNMLGSKEENLRTGEFSEWEAPGDLLPKYQVRDGIITRKTIRKNNSREQSKIIFDFDAGGNIKKIEAFDQKGKQLLYEARYAYRANGDLEQILYLRHSAPKGLAASFTDEYQFVYDKVGNLIEIPGRFRFVWNDHQDLVRQTQFDVLGNELNIQEFEYTYPTDGMWDTKVARWYRVVGEQEILVREKKERVKE